MNIRSIDEKTLATIWWLRVLCKMVYFTECLYNKQEHLASALNINVK